MKTNLKGMAFLLLPLCIVLGCESPKPTDSNIWWNGPPPPTIFIGRSFNRPGRYPWTNGMMLKDGMAVGGGIDELFAHKGTLCISHWDKSQIRYRVTPERPLTNNPALQPGDHICFVTGYW